MSGAWRRCSPRPNSASNAWLAFRGAHSFNAPPYRTRRPLTTSTPPTAPGPCDGSLAGSLGARDLTRRVGKAQPQRVAHILRPVVTRHRRAEIVMVQKRRVRLYQREVVAGNRFQDRGHLRGVRALTVHLRRGGQQLDE